MSKTPAGGPGAQVSPSQSLYLSNLPEKIQKHDLKRALYMLFVTYGPVIDVTTLKTPKMRGQAHILFKDISTATRAMHACQGYEFFGKNMKIVYSKNRSNTLSKLTGDYQIQSTAQASSQVPKAAAPAAFPAPPGLPAPPAGAPPGAPPGAPSAALVPPPGLPPPPGMANGQPPAVGTKRPRDESDDEGDASMEEEDADGDEDEGAMEMSDESDD